MDSIFWLARQLVGVLIVVGAIIVVLWLLVLAWEWMSSEWVSAKKDMAPPKPIDPVSKSDLKKERERRRKLGYDA